jgi:hypothetical protein
MLPNFLDTALPGVGSTLAAGIARLTHPWWFLNCVPQASEQPVGRLSGKRRARTSATVEQAEQKTVELDGFFPWPAAI